MGDDGIVDGITGTLRASRDGRNRLATERAARLVADGAVRDDNSDDSCSLNHDRYNAETAPSCLVTASARSWQSGGQGRAMVRRRCLDGMVTGGLVVTVYSPPMTGNRPELPGFYRTLDKVNPVVAQ